MLVLLDSGPLGLATNPRKSPNAVACRQWLRVLVASGHRVIVPEIADYEVRRELLRAKKSRGLANLDLLATELEYLPLTTAAMKQAAGFWAQARQLGMPAAADPALDGDTILAAQGIALGDSNLLVATTNIGHLSHFVPAELWQNIIAR